MRASKSQKDDLVDFQRHWTAQSSSNLLLFVMWKEFVSAWRFVRLQPPNVTECLRGCITRFSEETTLHVCADWVEFGDGGSQCAEIYGEEHKSISSEHHALSLFTLFVAMLCHALGVTKSYMIPTRWHWMIRTQLFGKRRDHCTRGEFTERVWVIHHPTSNRSPILSALELMKNRVLCRGVV